eukprot:CAMPEP_0172513778 /NCGR_PEP_ID=MMETSP1066-20121228/255323_1 /TAXON_ID=671091 /ORGANISM="Coscinodiscus wailesii, Strain CCMP2513" /LENGTH=313 /DNA_ID=CAMNT_0013294187 /DNA_START=161 /DNA_END=1099 /DNA_ORIENTATION=-
MATSLRSKTILSQLLSLACLCHSFHNSLPVICRNSVALSQFTVGGGQDGSGNLNGVDGRIGGNSRRGPQYDNTNGIFNSKQSFYEDSVGRAKDRPSGSYFGDDFDMRDSTRRSSFSDGDASPNSPPYGSNNSPYTSTYSSNSAYSPNNTYGSNRSYSPNPEYTSKPRPSSRSSYQATSSRKSLPLNEWTHDMDREDAKQQLVQLTELILNSMITGDWSTYCTLADPSITCFEPEALGNLVEGLEFHKYYFDLFRGQGREKKVTMMSPQVRLMGDKAAIVTYVRLVQNVDEKTRTPISSRIEETMIWEVVDGRW